MKNYSAPLGLTTLTLLFSITICASDKTSLNQTHRFPIIMAGAPPRALKKSPRKGNSLTKPATNKVIAKARVYLASQIDQSCSECINLAKNQLLMHSKELINCLHCLEIFKDIPPNRLEQGIKRFQQDSVTFKTSPSEIRKACILWSYKPAQNSWCDNHAARSKGKKNHSKHS